LNRLNFEGIVRRSVFCLLPLLIAVLILFSPISAHSQAEIDIIGDVRPREPIAVPDFVQDPESRLSDPRLGTLLAEVVSGDLNFDGDFRVLQPVQYPAKFQRMPANWREIDFNAWKATGCRFLIHGLYRLERRRDETRLTLQCRVFDVTTRERVTGQRIGPERSEPRRFAHQLSNIVVETLTGRKGIFQTQIAFISNMTGRKEVWVCDYDGQNVRRLTNHRSICLSPKWSPDGGRIMFNSYKNRNPDLFVMDRNGKNERPLSEVWGLNTAADWSPDGREILLTLSKDGNSEIYRMGVRRRRLTRLTKNRVIDTEPTWSPNGKKIAYVSDIWGPARVFSMDANGRNIKRLTRLQGRGFSPAWSPRGDPRTRQKEQIAFVLERGAAADIYLMTPEGSDYQKLTNSTSLRDRNEDPAWSPDGRHLVFASNRSGKWNLYTMDINGGNVRRITFLGSDCTLPHWSPN